MLVGMRTTCRCLVKQLPFLYALPQCSQFSSSVAAFSFFITPVPSLALRFAIAGLEDKDGPCARALLWLLSRLGIEARCVGGLLGIAACETSPSEPGRLIAIDPSATPSATAASMAAALRGANDEVCFRLMRPLTEMSGI